MLKGMTLPRDPRPLYEQIAGSIRDDIRQGKYTPGAKLPSMAELAQAFGVSDLTVDRALKDLQGDGYVAVRHGRGTFVLDRPIDDLEQLRTQAQQLRDLADAHMASIDKLRERRRAARQEGP
jgi:DNA-binding GntR family transcriptional regulator